MRRVRSISHVLLWSSCTCMGPYIIGHATSTCGSSRYLVDSGADVDAQNLQQELGRAVGRAFCLKVGDVRTRRMTSPYRTWARRSWALRSRELVDVRQSHPVLYFFQEADCR